MQRYKLRLGDGTVLVVDFEGLTTWLVDDGAMVQVGRQRWLPLKQFVAKARAAARQAARQAPKQPPKPTASSREELPLVYPKPREEEPPTPPVGEPAGVLALADEPTGPPGRPDSPSDEGPASIPLKPLDDLPPIPLKPLDDDAPLRVAPPAPSIPAEPRPIGEPPAIQVLADEPAGPPWRPDSPFDAGPPSIPLKPLDDLPPIPVKPPQDEPVPLPEVPPWSAPPEPEPERVRPPRLPAPAREPVAPPAEEQKKRPRADDRRPVARPQPSVVRAPAAPRVDDERATGEALLRHPLAKTLLRAASRLGIFLSRCLDPISRLEQGLSPFPSLEERAEWSTGDAPAAPQRAPRSSDVRTAEEKIDVLAEDPLGAGEPGTRKTSDAGPWIQLKALLDVDAFHRAVAKLRQLFDGARAWAAGLTERIARPDRRDDSAPSALSREPGAPWPPGLAPPAPLKAPTPLHELPAIRLAPIHEPKEREEVYDGADDYDRVSLVHTAWLWAKRLVIVAALVAGGTWAVLSWDTWRPGAEQAGRAVFTEIDGRVRATQQAQEQEQAAAEAVEQVPYLSRRTIEAVLSSDPAKALEPPEVFCLAAAAADRGVSALSNEEAQELARLRRELIETLSPAERELVSDYETTRARRATFASEDQNALRLYAQGARALPSQSLGRLRVLFGKAIAAGLASTPAASPPER
jgi:hypothetical protein